VEDRSSPNGAVISMDYLKDQLQSITTNHFNLKRILLRN
jgi:hypothetical protein